MTDAQLIQRLRNESTDAVLSGDHVRALWLAQAAARLTELSIIHHTWHPSLNEVVTHEQAKQMVMDDFIRAYDQASEGDNGI